MYSPKLFPRQITGLLMKKTASGSSFFVGLGTKICRAFGIKDEKFGNKTGSAITKNKSYLVTTLGLRTKKLIKTNKQKKQTNKQTSKQTNPTKFEVWDTLMKHSFEWLVVKF